MTALLDEAHHRTAKLQTTELQTAKLQTAKLQTAKLPAADLDQAGPVQFMQTAPRHLVHRAALSEVFVTDLRVVGENDFQVGAQWPRRHSFLGPRTRALHDPLLYVETCRQAGLLVAHGALDVPLNYHFLSHSKSYTIAADGLRTCERPVDVVVNVNTSELRRRGKGLTGSMKFDCYRGGLHIGTTTEHWSCVSSGVYRRVRGDHFAATPFQATALPTVEPALVGRERPEDVLVAETPLHNVWALQFDPDHPVLFDHPVDHVPGMVLMEGARQAALLVVGNPQALPLHGEFDFASCIEFDEPCLVIAEQDPPAKDGSTIISVTFQQNGATAATATMEMLVP